MLNPEFIEFDEAIAIHDYLIGKYGGSFGLRDRGLLESALALPEAFAFGEFLHPTLSDMAAAYLYHISRNHAFIDGNKRTALAVTKAFLVINGHDWSFSKVEIEDLVLKTAQGQIEKPKLAELFQSHLIEP